MPDHIVISGVKPYDGRYTFDLGADLTTREWGWIKRLAGYLPANLDDDAWSDPELACVLAAIMLHRAGRLERTEVPAAFERLADAPFGSTIRIEVDETKDTNEDDAGPPPTNSNGNDAFSGDVGKASSGTSPTTPPDFGTQDSATSLSDRPTLVT